MIAVDSPHLHDAQPARYSILQISLHRIIGALVIFQLVFGESMTHAVDAAAEGTVAAPSDAWPAWFHYWFGILALVALRCWARLDVWLAWEGGFPQKGRSSVVAHKVG